jgi:hypothetical protein
MQSVKIYLMGGKSIFLYIFLNSFIIIQYEFCWIRTNKKDPNSAYLIAQSIESKLSFVLLLLNHSDDDISECVTEFCMHYISMLKVTKIQNREQQTYIEASKTKNYALIESILISKIKRA